MVKIPTIHIKKMMCGYCNAVFLRTKEGEPKGCPKCHYRFVGKKAILLTEIDL
jgi:uncharacterized CHY-type Zn-finger protein